MIDIKALKSRFIDLAIRGKLVPQLDEEPSVEQIGEGPAETPFEIPEKWKWVYLKKLSKKIQYGFTASAMQHGTCKLLRITDIQNGNVNWNTVPFCEIDSKNILNYLLNVDDIVIARTGGTIGKSFLIENCPVKSVFASYLIRIIPNEEDVYSKYLIYFLNSPEYWKQILDVSKGTGQPNVNGKSLSKLKIPLPPLSEQHRIVARLNEIFTILDKAEDCFLRVQDLGKSLKNKFLQMAIEGKLVPQLDEEPPVTQLGDIPEDPLFETPKKWKTCYLENISESISDGSHNPPPNTGSGIPVLSAKNINQDRIDFSIVDRWTTEDNWKYENKKINIENGDVLLTIVGTIGRTAVVHTTEKFILQRSVCIIKVNKKLIDSDYLTFVIQSTPLIKWMYENASGTAQKGIYLKTVKKLQIPLPPLSEQRRIVTRLNELFALVDKIIGVEAK